MSAGGVTPFSVTNPRALTSFAFGVLPLVIVISALSALLWYWRILPLIVGGIAFVLRRALGLGGATALASGATVFFGMIEAPLLIRPCLAKMTRTELFILFSVGLASVAGTMFVLYATVLKAVLPGALGHVLVASMMALPAAVMIARIMVPGDAATEEVPAQLGYRSSMDAVAKGTEDGLKIYLQIMALLIVMVALISLADQILGALPVLAGAPITLERVLGLLFAPLAWLYGVPWREAGRGGKPSRHQDHPQRAGGLSPICRPAQGHARSPLGPDHGLCAVRLRQFRQRGDSDRGHERLDAGAAGRDRAAGLARHGLGHLGERAFGVHDRASHLRRLLPRDVALSAIYAYAWS